MRFDRLRINNLRCLEQIEMEPAKAINLLCGPNGSGKTSILEGFAMAALGRSFLSNQALDVIRSNTPGLSVKAQLSDPKSGATATVQVRKLRGETQIEWDGKPVLAASSLAQRVPLLVINSKATDLLTESPSNRRALVDRTMFHVEPDYVDCWKRYRQALRQRNELLRHAAAPRDFIFWDAQLLESAAIIDARRQRVVEAINRRLCEWPLAVGLGGIQVAYTPGWNTDKGFRSHLQENTGRDRSAGFTSIGAHRADLAVKAAGRSLAKRLSRGQSKLLVVAIIVAIGHFIRSHTAHSPVFLVDDLHAELDDKMCAEAVDMILHLDGQTVFTAIRAGDLPERLRQNGELFHVEHLRNPFPA
ncbi:MAG: DNA replication and repair protein RecF [Gammaproteobacteria bacterium]